MLHFENLSILQTHQNFLHQILKTSDFFVVGGSARDVLLGINKNPTDIDITMPGKPDQIRKNMQYDEKNISRFRTEKFGTMTLVSKENNNSNIFYEITPLRTEGGYEDFRHPGEIIRSDNLLLDAARRDFTINCIYRYGKDLTNVSPDFFTLSSQNSHETTNSNKILDDISLIKKLQQHQNIYLQNSQTLILQDHESIDQLFAGGVFQKEKFQKLLANVAMYSYGKTQIQSSNVISIIVDPYHGIQDMLQGKLCTVGDPDKRFTEDALRIIRGVRFPILLNQKIETPDQHSFDFEKKTRASMTKNAGLLSNIAKERLYEEITKVFKSKNPFGYISLLDELGLIEILFPALAETKGNTQPTRYHPFDTFVHTLLTLHALQQINDNYLLKLAILYHDVGKPQQYAYISKAKNKNPDNPDMSNYMHHTEISLPFTKKDFQNLGFSKKEIEEISWYIRWHHRPHEILESKPEKGEKKLRKMISEVGLDMVLHLMDLVIADRLGQFNPLQTPAIKEIYQLKERAQNIFDDEGRFTIQEMKINGNIIMEHYNIPPGPQLGKILQQCFERVLMDVNNRNNTKLLLQHVKSLL